MDVSTVGIILGSTFLGSLVTAMIQKKNNDSNNELKHITDERTLWRKTIRANVIELVNSENFYYRAKLISELQINLNPLDDEDNKIIECSKRLLYNGSKENKEELLERVSLLLKHDWERVKLESNKNRFFPKTALIIILITISIVIQPLLLNIGRVQFIKELIGIDMIFYLLSIGFIAAWIVIICNIIFSVIFSKKTFAELCISDCVFKIFKIPVRHKSKNEY